VVVLATHTSTPAFLAILDRHPILTFSTPVTILPRVLAPVTVLQIFPYNPHLDNFHQVLVVQVVRDSMCQTHFLLELS